MQMQLKLDPILVYWHQPNEKNQMQRDSKSLIENQKHVTGRLQQNIQLVFFTVYYVRLSRVFCCNYLVFCPIFGPWHRPDEAKVLQLAKDTMLILGTPSTNIPNFLF